MSCQSQSKSQIASRTLALSKCRPQRCRRSNEFTHIAGGRPRAKIGSNALLASRAVDAGWLAFGAEAARAAANYEPYTFTHFAGSFGGFGYSDGTGSAARFNYPEGVAVDSSGNVYVAESGNNVIRQITPGGVVSTLAGLAGSSGTNDGTGSAARFYYPGGVAVDASGNVYVAD